MQHLISIVILNWNGSEHIKECLESLYSQTYRNFEIIMVDNGSIDNSKNIIKKFKKVNLIENTKNNGFAKANNQGIGVSKGDYVLTLNNDIRADKNLLKELVNAVKKYPDAGIFSCKMLFYFNPSIINSKGLKLYYDAKAVDIDFNTKDVPNEEIREVFGACAGAALYKKELIKDISQNNEFFDEDFFLYSEDLDVSLRAKLRNWKCFYVPKAIIYHKHNATAKKVPDLSLYHYTKNKILLIIKDYPLTLLIKYLPVILLRQIFSLIYYTFKFRFSAIKSRLVIPFYLPRMLKKRYKIQKTKKLSNKELKKWLLPRPILKSIFN